MKNASAESASLNLAIIRFLYFLFIFYFLSPNDYFLGWSSVPEAFWSPMGLLAFFDKPPVSADVHNAIYYFWAATIPLCGLGLFYRIVAPLNFFAGLFVSTYASSFGVHTHTYMPVILAGLPLAFSYASDSFSIDQIMRRKKLALHRQIYEAPVRTMQIVFCSVFFISAIAKIRFGGLDWVTSDTLHNYLIRASHIFPDASSVATDLKLGSWLAEHTELTHWFAAFTIVFEFLIPVAFFYRPSVKFIVPSLLVMQTVFFFVMYVNFISFLAIYIVWINWASVAAKLQLLLRPLLLKEKSPVIANNL